MKFTHFYSSVKLIAASCIAFIFLCNNSNAQKTRFKSDDFFSGVKITRDVVYGANIPFLKIYKEDLKMDVYEPENDPAEKRPVIILVHAGSFLDTTVISIFNPNKPLGTKRDFWIEAAANKWAKMGYVVVSIDHRVGWAFSASTQEELGRSILKAVWRGISDLKACIRFLRYDAANANKFRIDPDRIVAGGSSSGGYLPIHTQVLDKPSELLIEKFLDSEAKPFIDTLAANEGNFDGVVKGVNESGSSLNTDHLKYSHKLNAVISIGGAVAAMEIIEPGDPVIIATHGVMDKSTPYKTSIVQTAVGARPIIEVSGSHDMVKRSTEVGNQKILIDKGFNDQPFPGLKPFEGVGFEPFSWYRNSTQSKIDSAKVYLDSLVNFITPRIYEVLELNKFSNIASKIELPGVSMSPNPVKDLLTIQLPSKNQYKLEILDLTGRSIHTEIFEADKKEIHLDGFTNQFYILKITDTLGRIYQQKFLKED